MFCRPIGLATDDAYLCFDVKDGCQKNVYAKNENAKYQFTQETIDVCSCGVYNGMLYLDPFAPLEEVTQGFSKQLHKAARNTFCHTIGNAPTPCRVMRDSWYGEECHDTRRDFERQVTRRICDKQARATFQCFVRKKMSSSLAKFEPHL